MYRIGIDVGGTFTDFTLVDEQTGGVAFHKVPSTPHDPSEAIERGIAELLRDHAIQPGEIGHIGHGTTVATNLIIERKGASCGLITTRGFRDVLELARQTRPHLYDYTVVKPPPLVPRMWRKEVGERLLADGSVREPLDEGDVRRAALELREAGVESVAICFLHAYRNPTHERRARDIVREVMPDVYVSVSSEVLPEFREYERLSTTAMNASIGPRMQIYLRRFLDRVAQMGIAAEPLTIHSNGGLMSVETVRSFPVRTCLSGPAAGVVGAAEVGRVAGFRNLVTFDVGGTSTDVSLIVEGQPVFTSNRTVAGYPVKTPMIDIHVIGAGGGSIAWLDEVGSLKVGPHSAGAVPGPVGYGRGGIEPTITDAQIALHRLNPVALLKGAMPVYESLARRIITEGVAAPLGLTAEAAADGIVRIANANMSRAIRSVSTERGYDLSAFALFAFGGAGPLHAMDVARECGIPVVVVPREPGTMCARGMLLTDISFDFVESEIAPVDQASWVRVCARLSGLRAQAQDWLGREGVARAQCRYVAMIDARYVGQNFEVQVPIALLDAPDLAAFESGFHQAHLREYGYNVPERTIEIINCRVRAIGQVVRAEQSKIPPATTRAAPVARRPVYFGAVDGWVESDIYDRDALGAGAGIDGPAIIEEMSSTTVIAARQSARVDDFGNLIVRIA